MSCALVRSTLAYVLVLRTKTAARNLTDARTFLPISYARDAHKADTQTNLHHTKSCRRFVPEGQIIACLVGMLNMSVTVNTVNAQETK